MVALNVCAVTLSFEDGEKRKPDRIVKVYILPPSVGVGTASATSGTICDPAGAGLSGDVTRLAQVAYMTTVEGTCASAGSRDEKSSCMVKCAVPGVTGGGGGAGATVTHTRPGGGHQRRRAAAQVNRLGDGARARIEPHDGAVAGVGDPQRGRRGQQGRRAIPPTLTVAATAPVSGLIRTSASSPALATHTPAALTATASGP